MLAWLQYGCSHTVWFLRNSRFRAFLAQKKSRKNVVCACFKPCWHIIKRRALFIGDSFYLFSLESQPREARSHQTKKCTAEERGKRQESGIPPNGMHAQLC